MRKLPFCLCSALAAAGWLFFQPTPVAGQGGNTTTTTSTTSHSTFTVLAPVNLTSRGYSTQILGVLSNTANASNTTVFNVTVNSGLDLLEMRQQLELARQAVQAAHTQSGNQQLQISEAQLDSSQAPVSATTTNNTDIFTGSLQSVTTETTFGPGTILIGPDQSQTFFVPPGTTNVNTNTHTESFFNRTPTTMQTTTKSSVYRVVGVSRP